MAFKVQVQRADFMNAANMNLSRGTASSKGSEKSLPMNTVTHHLSSLSAALYYL
jgi:hypothetical protein